MAAEGIGGERPEARAAAPGRHAAAAPPPPSASATRRRPHHPRAIGELSRSLAALALAGAAGGARSEPPRRRAHRTICPTPARRGSGRARSSSGDEFSGSGEGGRRRDRRRKGVRRRRRSRSTRLRRRRLRRSRGSGPGLSWLLYGAIIAAIVALAIWLGRRAVNQEVTEAIKRKRAASPGPLRPGRARARWPTEAERNGETATALRLRFQACLLRLAEAGAIKLRPSLTARGAGRQLRSAEFDEMVTSFESVAYGGREPSRGEARAARESWPARGREAGRRREASRLPALAPAARARSRCWSVARRRDRAAEHRRARCSAARARTRARPRRWPPPTRAGSAPTPSSCGSYGYPVDATIGAGRLAAARRGRDRRPPRDQRRREGRSRAVPRLRGGGRDADARPRDDAAWWTSLFERAARSSSPRGRSTSRRAGGRRDRAWPRSARTARAPGRRPATGEPVVAGPGGTLLLEAEIGDGRAYLFADHLAAPEPAPRPGRQRAAGARARRRRPRAGDLRALERGARDGRPAEPERRPLGAARRVDRRDLLGLDRGGADRHGAPGPGGSAHQRIPTAS